MTNICIVPARSGSKRIPNKNIRPFLGKPILERVYELIKMCKNVDRIILSTDSEQYASIARGIGFEIPFLRGSDISDGITPTHPVILDCIDRMDIAENDCVSCVYATSVLMDPSDLEQSFEIVGKAETDTYVVPVCAYPYPIQRALASDENGLFNMVDRSKIITRTQDLPIRYHDTGLFYTARARHWKQQSEILVNFKGLEIPNWRVSDIDDYDDWIAAEMKYKIMKQSSEND